MDMGILPDESGGRREKKGPDIGNSKILLTNWLSATEGGQEIMLTRELAIAEYDRGRILPDRLTRRTHRPYIDYADRMLAAYRDGLGRTRRSYTGPCRIF